MPLALLLIVIGIILAIVVNYALGIICIVIGLVLLLLPWFRGRGASRVYSRAKTTWTVAVTVEVPGLVGGGAAVQRPDRLTASGADRARGLEAAQPDADLGAPSN